MRLLQNVMLQTMLSTIGGVQPTPVEDPPRHSSGNKTPCMQSNEDLDKSSGKSRSTRQHHDASSGYNCNGHRSLSGAANCTEGKPNSIDANLGMKFSLYLHQFTFRVTECKLITSNTKKRRIHHRPLCCLTVDGLAMEMNNERTNLVVGYVGIQNTTNELLVFTVGDKSAFHCSTSDGWIHGHPWPVTLFGAAPGAPTEDAEGRVPFALHIACNNCNRGNTVVRVTSIMITNDEKLCLEDLLAWSMTSKAELGDAGFWMGVEHASLPLEVHVETGLQNVITTKLHNVLATTSLELHMVFDRIILATPMDTSNLYTQPGEWVASDSPAVLEVLFCFQLSMFVLECSELTNCLIDWSF